MERLTMTSAKGGVAFTFDLDITCEPSEARKILKLAEKLKQYEDAEEQGLLLRLPFKIGQKVYYIYESYVGTLMIGSMIYSYSCLDFQRAYFATKEEAEQALKQMGEKV